MLKGEDTILNDGAQYKWSPSVQSLIDWFVLNESNLPMESFALSSYEKVVDALKFYERLRSDIASTQNKFREGHLLNVLEKLRRLVNT